MRVRGIVDFDGTPELGGFANIEGTSAPLGNVNCLSVSLTRCESGALSGKVPAGCPSDGEAVAETEENACW